MNVNVNVNVNVNANINVNDPLWLCLLDRLSGRLCLGVPLAALRAVAYSERMEHAIFECAALLSSARTALTVSMSLCEALNQSSTANDSWR